MSIMSCNSTVLKVVGATTLFLTSEVDGNTVPLLSLSFSRRDVLELVPGLIVVPLDIGRFVTPLLPPPK